MSDKLLVQLNTDKVDIEPGGAPFEAVVTVQNLSNVVDQYTIELSGLDREWFDTSVSSVRLFDGDRDAVRLTLHPPGKARPGAYPFRVLARSRDTGVLEVAEATLLVRGQASFRADVRPLNQTARRQGKYKLEITNTGNTDVRVALEASDAENACRVKFADSQPLVPAGNKKEVPFKVQPIKRPWIGAERPYDFTVTAKPQDARGEPKTLPAKFTYKPLFASWAPIFTLGKVAVVCILLVGVVGTLRSLGAFGTLVQTWDSGRAAALGVACKAPLIDRFCPEEYFAFREANVESAAADAGTGCKFEFGFREFADAEPKLVGECTSKVYYDHFGNGVQYTRDGMLFWQKDANTIYFYRKASIWGFIQGHSQLLYGSGAF